MIKNVKICLSCVLALLLAAFCLLSALAEDTAPVFKAHVVGETALCDETTPVYVKPGETVLVWFELQEADEVYIPGWISKTLTEAGFELAYDPEFAEENYCAKVTAPANLTEGARGLLEINWYKPGELYGVFEGRWSDAPFYYTHHLAFIAGAPAAPAFTDTDSAKESGGFVYARAELTAEALLAQAPGGSLKTSDGKLLTGKAPVASGTVLTKSDGTKKTVVIKGDNNGDGKIGTDDARKALRASIGLETPNEWQTAASLIVSKDKIGTSDARGILRAAIGLEALPLV